MSRFLSTIQCYLWLQEPLIIYIYPEKFFQGKWAQKGWPKDWIKMGILKDITFLELFPVVVALCIWGEQLKNKKIIFSIDNQSGSHYQ
jgi:hypothetical protein